MLQKYKAKREEGFTIIEVLIVLAIAGLIILIVLLAVPALQRNQRNTARRNDVSRIGGAIQEYSNNNNGATPTTSAHVTEIVTNAGNLSQYTRAEILPTTGNITTGTQGALTDSANMQIVTGARCDTGTAGAATATNASTRNVVIQYMVETSGNVLAACQEV